MSLGPEVRIRPTTRTPGGTHHLLSGDGWLIRDSCCDSRHLGLQPPPIDGEWRPAHVPGTVQANFFAAGLIPDPYARRNNEMMKWMEERTWWFARKIPPVEVPAADRILLEFDGVDYFCRVWLNGELLGDHEGMFGGPQFDVTSVLSRERENLLIIGFPPPPLPGPSDETDVHRQRLHSFSSAVESDGRIRRHYRGVFNQGWAYLRLATSGIWQDVRLVGLGSANIEDVSFATRGLSADRSRAEVHIGFAVEGLDHHAGGLAARVQLSFQGNDLAEREILLDPRTGDRQELALSIEQPPLWHPNGLGPQELCLLELRLLDPHGNELDRVNRTVGIRHFELAMNPGPEELYPWTFAVNHQPFFARGFNWVPRDAMLRVGAASYQQHLHAMAATGANLVRVWGWGLVETDAFYDLCDELGLLVWQEFPIAHGEHDDDNLEVLHNQAAWIVERLRTRASLAMWSGGNELHLLDPSRSTAVLDYLEDLIPRLDPDHPYRRTSPYGGDHHFGGCAQDESVYANDESYLTKTDDPAAQDNYAFPVLSWIRCALDMEDLSFRKVAFVSEIPTPTIMPEESLRKVVDAPELEEPLSDLPLGSTHPQIRHHCDLQFDWFPAVVARSSQFGNLDGRPFRELIPLFQYQQAIAYRSIAESFRGNWPRTSGLLYWVFNSPSPMNTWEVMDWFGVPLPSYYFVKRAFAPEMAVARFPRMFCAPGEVLRIGHRLLQDPGQPLGRERIMTGRIMTAGLQPVDEFSRKFSMGEGLADDATCPEFVITLPQTDETATMIYLLDLRDGDDRLLSRMHYPIRIDRRVLDADFLRKTRAPMAHMRLPDGEGKLGESVAQSPTTLALSIKPANPATGRVPLTVKNTGGNAAFMVELRCGKMEASLFSDNYFLLLPGEEHEVTCWSPAGVAPEAFSASAWNSPMTTAIPGTDRMVTSNLKENGGESRS